MLFILRQDNAIQTFQQHSSKSNQLMSTHPSLHLPSSPISLRVPKQEIYATFPHRTCHMSNQSHSSSFYCPNNFLCNFQFFIHSLRLSYDNYRAQPKASTTYRAIQYFLFQQSVSSHFLMVIQ